MGKKLQATTQQKKPGKVRKKIIRNVPAGVAHVRATFNNTIIVIADPSGGVLVSSSAGRVGYSGSRKSSAFAATVAAQDASKKAQNVGVKELEVELKGAGAGREAAVRGFISSGIQVTKITDKTPIPHNGCRPRKRRRV